MSETEPGQRYLLTYSGEEDHSNGWVRYNQLFLCEDLTELHWCLDDAVKQNAGVEAYNRDPKNCKLGSSFTLPNREFKVYLVEPLAGPLAEQLEQRIADKQNEFVRELVAKDEAKIAATDATTKARDMVELKRLRSRYGDDLRWDR